MRPDTRSFSFTWMKGQTQKTTKLPHQKLGEEEEDSQKQSASSSSSSQQCPPPENENWAVQRGNSGSRLRKLGNSLVRLRNAGRYANLEDENNWQKISEEVLSLEEDDEQGEDEMAMEVQIQDKYQKSQPDVVAMTTTATREEAKSSAGPVPFQPRENYDFNVGAGAETAGMSLSKRLNRTVQGVKASLGNFSQKFRKSTRRRYRVPASTPGSVASPATRKILGRTPTKLYSPFGIETPISMKTPKRLADRPSTPRLTRKSMVASLAYSPSNNFRRDLDEARRGMRDFHILSRDITRRSVRF